MNPFLFIANFKMNPVTAEEVEQYLQVLTREVAGKSWENVIGILCPSFLHAAYFRNLPPQFFLGSQHGFPEKSGAYTGEVSFAMLKNIGTEYSIIGHSERREYFEETDETVRIRTEAALKFLMKPIVCIGETEDELVAGKRDEIITRQIETVLQGLSKMQAEKIIFAYEPRFAIGTGRVPTTESITEVEVLIRGVIERLLGEASAARVQVVYGGSVKANNMSEVAFATGLDGVLVGKESLSPYEVVKMMELAEKFIETKKSL
jgi:triosephosphate isomerase